MRPRKHPEPARVVIPPRIEAARSSTKAPASANGPTVSHAARPPRAEPDRGAPPRLSVPDRQQLLSAMIIDELLEPDHPARAVWAYVEGLDLTPLFDRIRARGRVAGRPAIDPRLLVALWLYATLAGFTSARELADLCLRHDAFRWLAGGVSVNYHTLADFRTDHPAVVEQLLKQSVKVLRQEGRIDLDRIAQDGMRVRAGAGAASFHRRATLERLLEEARAELQELRRKLAPDAAHPADTRGVVAEDPPAGEPELSPREAAAMRHAEQRVGRVERALERMPEMEAKVKPGDKKEARVSTTDPQATVMKMADGGFRPAYNVEYATTCDGQVVVGVEVVTVGSDHGQMPPCWTRSRVASGGARRRCWSMAASRTWKTSRECSPVGSARSLRPWPSRGRRRWIGMSRKRRTVKRWRGGESEWGRTRPRRSTRRGPRRRSASTPRRAIAAWGSSWSEASRRSSPSRRGSPSPRTWRAVSLSNRDQDDHLFLTSPQMLVPFFHSL
jgi:transposase